MASESLTMDEIAEIVIELLAAQEGIPSDQLRARLEAGGPELPVDSLLVVEVLTKVEGACGLRIHVDAETARSTRSVMTFARTIHNALPVKVG